MDFIKLNNAIEQINILHKTVSENFFDKNAINLRRMCVKDFVSSDPGKISEEFLDYIEKYYGILNSTLIMSDFDSDYSNWDARIRIKQKESVQNKLYYYLFHHNKGEIPVQKCLNDLLGFRLIIEDFSHDSTDTKSFLQSVKKDLHLMKCYTRDKDGYLGTHIYFKNSKNIYFPWELQVWNTSDAKKNEIAHSEHKAKRNYINWPKQYKDANLRKGGE